MEPTAALQGRGLEPGFGLGTAAPVTPLLFKRLQFLQAVISKSLPPVQSNFFKPSWLQRSRKPGVLWIPALRCL